jgi:hypothetical protein
MLYQLFIFLFAYIGLSLVIFGSFLFLGHLIPSYLQNKFMKDEDQKFKVGMFFLMASPVLVNFYGIFILSSYYQDNKFEKYLVENGFKEFITINALGIVAAVILFCFEYLLLKLQKDPLISIVNSVNKELISDNIYFNYENLELKNLETGEIIAYYHELDKTRSNTRSMEHLIVSGLILLSWIGFLIELILGANLLRKKIFERYYQKSPDWLKFERLIDTKLNNEQRIDLIISLFSLTKAVKK